MGISVIKIIGKIEQWKLIFYSFYAQEKKYR